MREALLILRGLLLTLLWLFVFWAVWTMTPA